jgi:Tol biopolymer transport system component/imidazolonepropionase-like amidohydrolase
MKRLISCSLSLFLAACAVSDARQLETETISIETREGTELAFDLAPNDSTIVFDLLGQLWTMPARGGDARAITDAVGDTAEDLDPAISPDGRTAVFRAERHGRTGLWLIELASGKVRQLTQVANPDEYQGDAAWSPDGKAIAFTHLGPDSTNVRWYSRVQLLDVASGVIRDVTVERTPRLQMRAPAWTPDGKKIAFVAAFPANPLGGRAWIVDAGGGRPSPLSPDSTMAVLAASFAPDGKKVALLAGDSLDRPQVWTQEVGGVGNNFAAPRRLTAHDHVASTRVRWTRDGSALLYAADGKLRRMSVRGDSAATIEFRAHLSVTRPARHLPPARLIDTSAHVPARAFLGLALSPDGKRIGAIALGKLWVIPVGGRPHAVTDVPFTARGLSWSPNGKEVAWSAGPFGEEDLFAADVNTGVKRQITALAGREAVPSYSPDGRSIAFMHRKGEQPGALRIIDAHATSAVTDTLRTRKLGPGAVDWTRRVDTYPQWSPASDALLVIAGSQGPTPPSAKLVRLSGSVDTIAPFLDNPIFFQWNTSGGLTFVRHDRLWRVAFDGRGLREQPRPLGDDAALYASTSNDGSILYISSDGLRLRSPSGAVRRIGWPITYTPPVAPPLVIRNAHIVDGKGNAATAPSDILIERGRIARIAAGGTIKSSAKMIDAAGKFVMPGLMDLHAHTYRNDLLPGPLYFGVTTVRDQGSSIGPLVAYADGISAGVTPGPRIAYGGFQFYSDWGIDEEQGRGIEPEADSDHVRRSVGLAQAFGAQHIKTRTFRRWDINARMIAEAHRRGMRATGHCATQLPLIAAGMDAKEHLGFCSTRGAGSPYASNDMMLYDDQIQLLRAAGISVVPTIIYMSLAVAVVENPKLLDADTEVAQFISKDDFESMPGTDKTNRARLDRAARDARATLSKLVRAGVTVGTGTDVWQLPTAVHLELEEFVASGLTPAEAIRAATSSAARIIGVSSDLGSVEPGKWADLVIVDANPLADIRNTRRISAVLQGGRVVDRAAIRASFVRP